MNEKILATFSNIVSALLFTYLSAKHIHWHLAREYGQHLLFDRIADGLLDSIDTIQERYLLGMMNTPTATAIPYNDYKTAVSKLKEYIGSLLKEINTLDNEEGITTELDSSLGTLAEDLKTKLKFLERYSQASNN